MEGFKNEIWAADVIKNQPEKFDHLEISGVRSSSQVIDGKQTRGVNVNNANPEFYSVYIRDKAEGMAHCIADFGTHAEAVAYGKPLAANYGWSFEDQLAVA